MIIDLLISRTDFSQIILLTILHFFLSSSVDLVFTYKSLQFKKLGTKISFYVRNKVFEHVLNLPISFFYNNKQGDIFTKVTGDVEAVENFTTNSVISIITNIIETVAIIVIMCTINLKLTILTLMFIPLTSKLHSYTNPKIRCLSEENRENISKINSAYYEILNNIHVVKLFNGIKKAVIRTISPAREYAYTRIRLDLYSNVSGVLAQFATCVSTVLLFYIIGGYDVFSGKMTLGDLLAFSFYMAWIVRPVLALFKTRVAFNRVKTSYSRIQALLELERETESGTNNIRFEEHVRLDKVTFSYPDNDVSTIQNINFEIKKNQVTAIVGQSGCGKSTIVSLLLRMYECESGNIWIDDFNYKDVSIKAVRRLYGVVSQDSYFFDGTIKNNLELFISGTCENKIIEACKTANIHDHIIGLPNGYKTIIGEKGVKLSGGQKQRLAIARAVLYEPEILVLDEATSHLDNESEYKIKKALEKLRHKYTILIIAHRLSTVVDSDIIYVMDDGKIQDSGTHKELLLKSEYYKKMWSLNNET